MAIELRTATAEDIGAVLRFWLEAAEPTSTDSAEALAGLLRRDPGALLLAEQDGRILGSVIAGWDGWRGSIYRLAVSPGQRRSGLGQMLLGAAEDRLRELGRVACMRSSSGPATLPSHSGMRPIGSSSAGSFVSPGGSRGPLLSVAAPCGAPHTRTARRRRVVALTPWRPVNHSLPPPVAATNDGGRETTTRVRPPRDPRHERQHCALPRAPEPDAGAIGDIVSHVHGDRTHRVDPLPVADPLHQRGDDQGQPCRWARPTEGQPEDERR